MFTATTVTESKGDDSWANIKFKPAGIVEDPTNYAAFKEMNAGYATDGFTVDQSDEKGSEEGENF